MSKSIFVTDYSGDVNKTFCNGRLLENRTERIAVENSPLPYGHYNGARSIVDIGHTFVTRFEGRDFY